MASKQSIHWPSLLVEALFLVLGVLLALSANTLRENRQNTKRAEAALSTIIDEVSYNHSLIQNSINYHSTLFDTLNAFNRQFGQEPDRQPGFEIFSRGYVSPATTVSSAWETTMATGIVEHLAYADVLTLSEMYEHQSRYEDQTLLISENIYSMLFQDGPRSILRNYRSLSTIIGTFLYSECNLAREYSEILSEYADSDQPAPETNDACAQVIRR